MNTFLPGKRSAGALPGLFFHLPADGGELACRGRSVEDRHDPLFEPALWIPLSLLLYVLALLFSPSRIRAVDIFATNLFAMLPTIVILGVLSVPSKWLGGLVCEPRSACEVMKLAGYNLIVILLSVSMAWSMVWGCFAYLVSANMKGWRGISIFVICYVFVSVVNQLLIAYSK